MRVGDLVEVAVNDDICIDSKFKAAGPAIIIKLSVPTLRRPYQIATVQFGDGTREQYVTTILRALSETKKDVD
jgi:hypothetical protein